MALNVVHLVNRLGFGGAERLVVSFAQETARRGHTVSVVSLLGPGELEEELRSSGVNFVPAGGNRFPAVRGPVRVARILNSLGCQVLHTHIARSDIVGLVAGRLAHVSVIVSTRHNIREPWEERRFHRKLYGSVLRRMDGVTAVSHAVAEHARQRFGVSRGQCRVINAGVDVGQFRPRSASKPLLEEWGIDPGDFVVATASRLVPAKGIDTVIRAVAEVEDRIAGLKLLILGDGPLRDELETLSLRLGVCEKVIFAGWQTDMPSCLSLATVFVQASLTEGLGLAIIEAMAMGKCAIGAAAGGIPELIEDGKSGLLVRPGDPHELARCLLGLSRNRADGVRLGNAAREEAVRRFSLSLAIDDLLRYYGFLLGKRYVL